MSLNVAVAYHKGDRDQFIKWMNWVNELGGLGTHKLYTIYAFDCEPAPDIIPSTKLVDADKIEGDWQSDSPARSAAAPNSMFRCFAWYFYLQKLGAWMFCEPDCVPLKKGWLDTLEVEYVANGKPFMGALVEIERVPVHMSGNGIYPQETPELGATLLQPTNWVNDVSNGIAFQLAFDVAGARDTLNKAHFTKLIQHRFRHPGFKSKAEFDAMIDPAAVVFHSNKDGSIYQFLSGKNSGGASESALEEDTITRATSPSTEVKAADSPLPTQNFPEETRRLAGKLAELADTPYRRRKVREALAKVGLI